MQGQVKLIDNTVKEQVLRYPLVEIIKKLFPDVRLRGRTLMCNPLRDERHPSFSCFVDYSGYQRWKDFATGETGDNLDFFRKAFPELGYVEALDRLSLLTLGRSVLADYVPGESVPFYTQARRMRTPKSRKAEDSPALHIISSEGYDAARTPKALVDYTRGRGISDEVGARFLRYVVYENRNRKGKTLIDPVSGLPHTDADGAIVKDEARYEAVGMLNDIGGYSLRVPATDKEAGFKGANISFISTLLCGGAEMPHNVKLVGQGDGFATQLLYDRNAKYLSINDTQGFSGVEPWAVGPAAVFLDRWTGRYLEGRELKGSIAVLDSLNAPGSREVDVVEGMFDAVSDIEFERLAGRGSVPARDLVVLNSISNIQWAVPFLSVHGTVHSLLDNDMSSAAGQKAYDVLKKEVESFSKRIGSSCIVRSDSGIFKPCKDINDYLRHTKGFTSGEAPKTEGKARKTPNRAKKPSAKKNGLSQT